MSFLVIWNLVSISDSHINEFQRGDTEVHENSMRDGGECRGADKSEEPRFKNCVRGERGQALGWDTRTKDKTVYLSRRGTSCTKGKGREQMKEKLLMVSGPWHRLYLPHVQSPVWSEYTDRSSLVRVHICSFAHPSFSFFYFLSFYVLWARQRENCPLVEERNWSFRILFLSPGDCSSLDNCIFVVSFSVAFKPVSRNGSIIRENNFCLRKESSNSFRGYPLSLLQHAAACMRVNS